MSAQGGMLLVEGLKLIWVLINLAGGEKKPKNSFTTWEEEEVR